ncbi:ABC transporter permease subunit [Aquibium sp. A9E412]|uniref:ABC transporter permease n=1 Tax=Aquibium sp. A9E412 TaxID=2976767 RepID=UPI0025AFDF4E|nr:ABC transporter permease subunit [Aquibium sp. A9E412]MDN2568057.1 ABC transporter permease subunit [Aquibium sp. A9E412]
MLARLGPPATVLLLAGPIAFGLAGTLLLAFGYLPALGGSEPTLAHFGALLARPALAHSALLSLAAGLVSALVSLAIVMAFVAAWAGTRAFARVQHLVSPLLAVPHAAAAFGLAFLIAPSGMLARLASPALTGWERPPDLLIVHDPLGLTMTAGLIAKEIPFLLLVTLAALPQVRLAETRALAASLGYGRVAGFVYGVWPQLYRQIRLAVFAVIAFASSVVDVAAILGPTTPAPLAVRLVSWMNDPDLSMRYLASAGALLQLAVTAAALGLWLGIERLAAALRDAAAAAGLRLRRDAALRGAALGTMLLAAAVVAAGLATLALWSVAGLWLFPDALPQRFTLASWTASAPHIARPLWVTLAVAATATALAVVLAVLCLRREDETGRRAGRLALVLIYLPLIVPQVAFLFGLQLFFVATGTDAGFGALVLAHLVFVMPYVFLSLSDPWRAFDRRYEAVAAGLGKPRLTSLLAVRLPMLARAVLTAAAVGFAVSVGQYLPTLLIGAGRLTTVTTEAVALAAGGNRRVIGVYAFLQMLLPAAGFLVATLVPALLFRHRRAMRV